MAKFTVNMPDDMYAQAIRAADAESIKEAIDEATPILKRGMESELRAAIKHSGESDTVASLTASKAKKAKNGAYIAAVYPKGKSSKPRSPNGSSKPRTPPASNAMKAAILNYGKKGQPARPWLTKAVNGARAAVEESLAQAFEENIDEDDG